MPRLGPDDFLDPRQFNSINATFYAAEPADYFRMRIYMLLLAMPRADEVGELLSDGVEWRGIRFKTLPSDGDVEMLNRSDGGKRPGSLTRRWSTTTPPSAFFA